MKHLFVCVLACLSSYVFAADFVIVDWRQALFTTNKALQINEEMAEENTAEIAKVKSMQSEITADRTAILKDKDILTDAEIQKMTFELNTKTQQYNEILSAMERKRMQRENAFVSANRDLIDSAIKELSTKYKVSAVLDKVGVVYYSTSLDITDELREKLNTMME